MSGQQSISTKHGGKILPQSQESREGSNPANSLFPHKPTLLGNPAISEMIANVPVFTLDTEKNLAIADIITSFGPKVVVRIINAQFINEALEFGTDRARVDKADFRRILDGSGYDVWGVEEKVVSIGLTKADYLFAEPALYFTADLTQKPYSSIALGIPEDRSAILIYDSEKLRALPRTDGYVFREPLQKKDALLGIIRFRQILNPIDHALIACSSIDDQIQYLEQEAYYHLHTTDDLAKMPYLSLKIIELLYSESLSPTAASHDRLSILHRISEQLYYESQMINFCYDMTHQLDLTEASFREQNLPNMQMMASWPDFVIETTEAFMRENANKLNTKYSARLTEIIEQAKQCKRTLGIRAEI